MADGDLMDLQDVLNTLAISEQDLQNMVAQGKLKAVRAGRTVKFRSAEVMSMKSGKNTEPTIIIPTQAPAQRSAQPPKRTARIDESAATVVPEAPVGVVPVETQEISLDDEELEILPLEDEAAATQHEAPVSADEELTVAEEIEEPYEEGAEETVGGRRSSRRSGRMSRRASQIAYAAQESPIWTGVLAFIILILLAIGTIFGTLLVKGEYDETNHRLYVPGGLTSIAYDSFKEPNFPERSQE